MNDINDYKKWKAAWEKSYPIYRDLCKELEENRKLFERLGAEMRSAVAHEEQLRVIALIEKHYNERNEVTPNNHNLLGGVVVFKLTFSPSLPPNRKCKRKTRNIKNYMRS